MTATGFARLLLLSAIWGAIFLGEPVTWATLVGGAMVLLGTAIVTGFSVRGLLRA
jgi:drug/metabolite transporter (DMT)-like permease